MAKKQSLDPRSLMEMAIEVMERSISEHRGDGKASPKVGAVLVLSDGTIDTAYRGELRDGDHAEFTLLERKNRHRALDGAVLYATLEPCAPGARKHPKLGCAERIVLARIKEVYVGITDPDPTVDRKGVYYLLENGVKVSMFDRDLQERIRKSNQAFIEQALERAGQPVVPLQEIKLSPLEDHTGHLRIQDLSSHALEVYRKAIAGGAEISDPEFNRLLVQQGVLVTNGTTVPSGFGSLLFGSNPRRTMHQAGLLATIRYPDGKEETRDFDGPMVEIPQEMEAWLRSRLPNVLDRNTMKASRIDALPFEVVREAVVNALIHRDYSIEGAKCHLVIDADTILVRSPGMPVEPIKLEEMKSFSAPMLSRNPVLHYVFGQLDMAEERGMGLRSLKNRTQDLGLPLPQYRWNAPYLDLTLYRHGAAALKELPATKLAELSPAEKKGWEWVATQEQFTTAAYQDATATPRRTALNHIKRFVDLGLVEVVGLGRAARYKVIRGPGR